MTQQFNRTSTVRQDIPVLSNFIGAGGGTAIIVVAKSIPDHYWFKPYIILAVPSISIALLNITDAISMLLKKMTETLSSWTTGRRLKRKLTRLKADPHISKDRIQKIEKQISLSKIRNIENMIRKLDGSA